MNDVAIRQFLDNPQNQWEKREIGGFVRYYWPRAEPPRWNSSTDILQDKSSRAFLGDISGNGVQAVDNALALVEQNMRACGFHWAKGPDCPVVLWDTVFPKPTEWDLPQKAAMATYPVAIPPERDDLPGLVLLPTHEPGKFGRQDTDRLASATVHEGFHALLSQWLGHDRTSELRRDGYWKKFEEMCAMMMERRVFPQIHAYLDYAQPWRATLGLSHCDNPLVSPLDPYEKQVADAINKEEYGHFPILSFLDTAVWPTQQRQEHWLKTVWQAAKTLGAPANPWEVLDVELKQTGGVEELFRQYINAAMIPNNSALFAGIHQAVGPPAVNLLSRPAATGQYIIGPLGAQIFSCSGNGKNLAGVVRISDHKRLPHTEVKAFRISTPPAAGPTVALPISPPRQQGKSRVWEIDLNNFSAPLVQIMVLQPNYTGSSAILSAEWR